MNNGIKWVVGVMGVLLALVALGFFLIAVGKGLHDETDNIKSVQVYLNDNDSVVELLQRDVHHLTRLIERMDSDSVVVTVSGKRVKCQE